MTIESMNHFTVLSSGLERSKAFCRDILGPTEGYRPPFTFSEIANRWQLRIDALFEGSEDSWACCTRQAITKFSPAICDYIL